MNLFQAANQYLEESDWKIMAVLKFCLISLGILVGLLVPAKAKKKVAYGCTVLFLLTYVPLMAKLFRIFWRERAHS